MGIDCSLLNRKGVRRKETLFLGHHDAGEKITLNPKRESRWNATSVDQSFLVSQQLVELYERNGIAESRSDCVPRDTYGGTKSVETR